MHTFTSDARCPSTHFAEMISAVQASAKKLCTHISRHAEYIIQVCIEGYLRGLVDRHPSRRPLYRKDVDKYQ